MTRHFEDNCLELLAAAYRERGQVVRQKELVRLTHIPQQDISDIMLSERRWGPNDSHLARTAWCYGFRYKIVQGPRGPSISVYEQVLGQHPDEPVLNDKWEGAECL